MAALAMQLFIFELRARDLVRPAREVLSVRSALLRTVALNCPVRPVASGQFASIHPFGFRSAFPLYRSPSAESLFFNLCLSESLLSTSVSQITQF